tara:strand:- start:138 stop:713 length:576 start_codon:yes stop_codon:yes gene_type:complete
MNSLKHKEVEASKNDLIEIEEEFVAEEFMQIEDYNYSVSNLGRIRCDTTNKIRKPSKDTNGYYIVLMYNSIDKVNKCKSVHRLIAQAFIPNLENKELIDHIDGNRTNNILSNLRWATSQENARNRKKRTGTSSQYKGGYFNKRNNNWRSAIMINGKTIHLGTYETEIQAGQAYNNYIIEHKLEEFFLLNVF